MNGFFERDIRLAALALVLTLSGCGGGGDDPGGTTPPDVVPDTVPEPIGFAVPVIEKVAPGLTLSSAAVVVEGIDEGLVIPASVKGGEIAVNSETKFVKGPVEVSLGDRIRVRAVAPDAFESSHTATLALGEGDETQSAVFTLKTGSSTFTVEPGAKKLTFKWNDMAGVSHYELYENADGVSGFTKVDLDIPHDASEAVLHDVPVHLIDWVNARYQLHACDEHSGCIAVPQHELGVVGLMAGFLPQMLKAANSEANDNFGYSLAISGDGNTLAVGARNEDSTPQGVSSDPSSNFGSNSGAVYVFTSNDGVWRQTGFVKAETGTTIDQFGTDVSLNADGTVLAVGAHTEDGGLVSGLPDPTNNDVTDSGAAYVFRLLDDVWTQEAYLKAQQPGTNDRFGVSLALNKTGDRLVVGAFKGDSIDAEGVTRVDTGFAEVFHLDGGAWTRDGVLSAKIADEHDFFGTQVAMSASGNVIAVSANGEDSNAVVINGDADNNDAENSGAAYVFRRVSGSWMQEAYVKAGRVGAGDAFGYAVDIDGTGDHLAIGAFNEDSGTQAGEDDLLQDSGAVYLFEHDGGQWSQVAFLKAPVPDAGDTFGFTIALSGDAETLVVGAIVEDSAARGHAGNMNDNSMNQAGAAYLYRRNTAGDWRFVSYLKALNTGQGDFFTASMAVSGDGSRLAVGAHFEDSSLDVDGGLLPEDDNADNSGAVYVY